MQVDFMTELLSSTGLGHFTRCSTLRAAFQSRNIPTNLYLLNDGSNAAFVQRENCHITDWRIPQASATFTTARNAIAIIDSYLTGQDVYEEIASRYRNLVCIDDISRIKYPAHSVILNPGIHGSASMYAAHNSGVIAGGEYVLLRKPFQLAQSPKLIQHEIQSVLITTGATDERSITPALVEQVSKMLSGCEINVIIGPGFKDKDSYRPPLQPGIKYHLAPSAEEMADLMSKVDLAITAGGQTTYELASLGTPFIMIRTIDNQNGNIQGFLANKAALYAGDPIEDDILPPIARHIEAYKPPDVRQRYSKLLQSLIPTDGATRAAGAILKACGVVKTESGLATSATRPG